MANLVYQNEEAALDWLSSTGDEVITLTSLGVGAGRQGALHDFGVAARAQEFVWRAWVIFATAPVVGEVVRLYLKTSDGSHPDNDDGDTEGDNDAAVSAEDKLKNLTFIGNIIVDEASATPEHVASGVISIPERYAGPVFWNATADALSATALDHGFSLTPVPMEVQ